MLIMVLTTCTFNSKLSVYTNFGSIFLKLPVTYSFLQLQPWFLYQYKACLV